MCHCHGHDWYHIKYYKTWISFYSNMNKPLFVGNLFDAPVEILIICLCNILQNVFYEFKNMAIKKNKILCIIIHNI